jgi:hypothetical protein
MVEGRARFPMFEKLLEGESTSVYHEELLVDRRIVVGVLIIIIGVVCLIFSTPGSPILFPLGLSLFLIGFLAILADIILNIFERRQYRFHGLSRMLMSKAIAYIDSQLTKSKDLVSTVPDDSNVAFSNYELISMRDDFIRFLESTTGLLTWPSDIITPIENDLQNNQRHLSTFVGVLVAIFIILVVSNYFLLISGSFWLVAIGLFLLVCCTIQCPIVSGGFMIKNRRMFRSDWIANVKRSDSIQLEESLTDIFSLLSSQFSYPLRLYVVKEYSQLTYTGRLKSTKSHIQLREAVLYPVDAAN